MQIIAELLCLFWVLSRFSGVSSKVAPSVTFYVCLNFVTIRLRAIIDDKVKPFKTLSTLKQVLVHGFADPCKRTEQCSFIQEKVLPQEADLDLALVVDGSREIQADEFAGIQQLLGSVVEQLAVSPQPRKAGNKARVAVIQQSSAEGIKPEFGLQAYQNQNLMKRHLVQNMQQLSGSSALGHTLEFALNKVLLKATHPRQKKMLFTVVGSQTAQEDSAKLKAISQKARCEGVALFVVTVGNRCNRTEVEEIVSTPVQQHLIHVGSMDAGEQAYIRRFFRVFINALSSKPCPALLHTVSLFLTETH